MDCKLATIPETNEQSENAVKRPRETHPQWLLWDPLQVQESSAEAWWNYEGTSRACRIWGAIALALTTVTTWACYATSRCSTKQ